MTKKPLKTSVKTLWVASDHAGFELKQKLLAAHPELTWKDLGPFDDSRVDYPDFAQKLCDSIKGADDRGVLICGSGQGMAIKANRSIHIRAALCWNEEVAQLARAHNDANVLCLGARVMTPLECNHILKAFLTTEFEGGRHQARLDKLR
jgi:ribose 5-phosphate isomerase B